MHPGCGGCDGETATRKWVSPASGEAHIYGNAHKISPYGIGGNGVVVGIYHNSRNLWSRYIAGNDSVGYDFDITLDIEKGDAFYFTVDSNCSNFYDSTSFNPTIVLNISLTQPPVASFTYFPEEPVVGEEITFDASSSNDPDGTILEYWWDFGDGNTAEGMEVTHTYLEAGEHTVTLTVTDNDGLTGSTEKNIPVEGKLIITNATTDKGSYLINEKATISCTVTDNAGTNVSTANVTAKIIKPDSSRETIFLLEAEAGNYEGVFTNTRLEGAYNIIIQADKEWYAGDTTTLFFDVVIPKIPLGGSISGESDGAIYKIYVPTRWGGMLTVTTDYGYMELYYPDIETKIMNAVYEITYEAPVDKHGWYYVKHYGEGSFIISNTFVQEGEAAYRPWNFWYWPILPGEGGGPNLYSDGGPLEKYDRVFGTNANGKEVRNGYGPGSGHCWGGSVASILLPEPKEIIYGGVTFEEEDMEGLVIKLADTDAKQLDRAITGIPSIKPNIGNDGADKYTNKFHNALRYYIRVNKKSLQSDLRDPDGQNPRAIWNHVIYKYKSIMEEAEGGEEDIIKISTTIYANADVFPSDNTIDRTETYVYKLRYKLNGEVEKEFSDQDWISATGLAPYNLWFIESSWFDGKGEFCNPDIKKENVEKLRGPFP